MHHLCHYLTKFRNLCNYWPYSVKMYHIWCKNNQETYMYYSYVNLGRFYWYLKGYVNLGRFRWYLHVLAKYISKSSQFLFNANLLSCYDECITCLIIQLYFVIYAITDLKATKCFTYGVRTYNIHNCITHMSIWDNSSEIYMFWRNKAPNLLNFTFIGIRCLFMMNASIVSLFDYISQ
jgi:hypothetical protein